MGKRKRTLSPKENINIDISSGPLKLKSGIDVKKTDSAVSEGNESCALKTETQDKISSSASGDAEATADDRPTPQLRISARVQNKQKREENKVEGLSSINSIKKDGSSQDEDEDEDKGKVPGGEGEKGTSHNGDSKKRRRAWELWSLEDKNTFFEAINECGKDFEAIQNFLLTKLRKKGIPTCVIKNKDQVRHFYYRTWHKISKHIKFKDDVKKSTQELYTLINYGELRRKVGGTLDEKKGQKLQELIQKGSTSVRVKGKSVRVRTPICRALKKLNEFPDDRDQTGVRVPLSVSVEVVPANISSWNYVQSLAHNPRVRVSCSMHRTLKSVIEHLQSKWKSTKLKIAYSLISSANFPVSLATPDPPQTIIRLRPPSLTDFNNVIIKPETQVKSFAMSLSSHSEMLQRKGEKTDFQSNKVKTIKASRKKKCSSVTNSDLVKEGKEGENKESTEGENKDEVGNDNKGEIKDKREGENNDKEEGEASQEEVDEGSDVEIEEEIETLPSASVVANSSLSSDDARDEEVVILSCHSPRRRDGESFPLKGTALPPVVVVKEEEPSPSPDYDQEVLNAVRNIKEEVTDPMETIHQLMALENVASSQEIEDDAEVVCIGENTRLSAQVRDSGRRRNQLLEEDLNRCPVPSESVAPDSVLNDRVGDDRRNVNNNSPSPPSAGEVQSTLETVSVGDQTFSSFAECIEKAKTGWTANTSGMITVGELYLMFGKNQQITLEYELEEEVNSSESDTRVPSEDKEKEVSATDETLGSNELSTTVSEVSENLVLSSSATLASLNSPPSAKLSTSQLPSLVVEVSNLASPLSKGLTEEVCLKSPPLSASSSKDKKPSSEVKDKRKLEVENLSSMMAKLLYMIKVISSSKGTSNEVCICGSTNNGTPSKTALNNLRSPSSNNRCLNGFLKSPGSTKSPRGCSVSLRSPKTPTMGSPILGQGEGLTLPQRNERVKPASAKRLIPEPLTEKSQVNSSVGDSASMSTKDKMPECQGEKASVTLSSNLDGSSGSGEFRVPVGPAPRNHSCQSPNPSFNAQLSKLLPRYSRPSRRSSARKNMVVQRQLPLMPHPAKNSQGFVTLKVGNLQGFNLNAVPSQISLPLSVSIAPTPSTLPIKEGRILQPIASKDLLSPQNINPSPPIVVQHPVSIPIPSELFDNKVSVTADPVEDSNSISVNVSGQQLLTVKMPSYPVVAAQVTTVCSPASITQSTSVTLASSSCVSTPTTACALPVMSDSFHSAKRDEYQNSDSNSLNNILTQTLSEIPYLTTPPCTPLNTNDMQLDNLLNSSNNSKNELGNFNENSNSDLLSMADMELSALGTPFKSSLITGTPTTFNDSSLLNTPVNVGNPDGRRSNSSDITPIKLNLSSLLSSASDLLSNPQTSTPSVDPRTSSPNQDIPQIHIPECSESLPLLDISIGGTISVKEQSTNVVHNMPVSSIVGTIPTISSIVNNIPSVSSAVDTILSTPGVMGTDAAELKIPSCISQVPEVTNIIGISPNIISSNVLPSSNIVTEMLKVSSAVGNMPHQITTLVDSSLSTSTAVTMLTHPTVVDELATASSNLSLRQGEILSTIPLTIQDSSTDTDISLSVTCVTTSITPGESSSSKKGSIVDESPLHLHQFQESNDKIMDITLSNSNSSSSFTSMLAAAASHPYLESVMENSLLHTPPRPMLSGGGAGGSGGAKSNLSFAGEGFESLSTIPISPPSSPSRLLRQAETQWMNNEANEFSLSSLLGSIDSSPLKVVGGAQPPSSSHAATLSHSAHIQAIISTLNDNSVDFTTTFANMMKRQTKDKSE